MADRRTVLRGLAAATTLTLQALPAVASTGDIPVENVPSADAELLAIGCEWAVSAARQDETGRLALEAADRYVDPDVREALFRGPKDYIHFIAFRTPHTEWRTNRQWYGYPEAIGRLRKLRLLRIGGWTTEDGVIILDRPDLPAQARRDEIVAAYEAWNAERDARSVDCGLTAAEEADQVEVDINQGLRRRIIEMPARTLEGLLLKARVMSWCIGGLVEVEDKLSRETDATDDTITLSIARDLVAMIEQVRA